MLVLSRKLNEEIIIDGKIRIVVVKINKDQVRLAIDAPKDVRVDRAEIHEMRNTFVSQDTNHNFTKTQSAKPQYAEDQVEL